MGLVTTTGIVLEAKPYKERDKLVKIFTAKFGKQTVLVRNAMTPRNQFYQAIQPLVCGEYVLNLQENHLGYIKAVKNTVTFSQINQDIYLKAYAVYWNALVNAALRQNEADYSVYQLLLLSYQCLEKGLDKEVISFIFELQMLKRFGVLPNFTQCSICGENKLDVVYDYSSDYGSIICQRHFNNQMKRYHAHPRAIYYIRRFLHIELSELKKIDISQETKQMIRLVIDQLYDDYLGLQLKSRKFINEMHAMEHLLSFSTTEK